ncbi:MAG TPA: hypothetical protein VLI05_02855 [Candidatus Saccharimonadia bacterium]|nr:hypothetical protein [Candidatus Saccharimonadia bacterium]
MAIPIPLTGISQLLDCIFLFVAWSLVGQRLKQAGDQAIITVGHIYRYFGYFVLFNIFMTLPYAVLYLRPDWFPAAMGWGYVVANIFLVISLSHLSRMVAQMVPQWSSKEPLIHGLWVVINVVLTGLNVVYVAILAQPGYDNASGVTRFHIPGGLGATLGMISLLAYLPALVLFVMNAVKGHGDQRRRSILLAAGMLLIMVVGPLHAVAANWEVFLLADALNVVSLVLLAGGVLYRIGSSLAASPQPASVR